MFRKINFLVFVTLLIFSNTSGAQSATSPAPGNWQFVVSTDVSKLPADMRDNFPDVDYEKCLDAEMIGTPKAFGLQASPAMWNRCSTENWALGDGKLGYQFQCDGGATLTGEVSGTYTSQRVTLTLISRPRPIVRDVDTIHQKIVAKRTGACKPEAAYK
jgi:Protein of unknown function (DUF3617)